MPILNSFNPSVAVNTGTDTITIPSHGLVNAQGVVYSNGNGTSIGGLVNGYKYYVIFVDSSNIKLANTEVEARANTFIDLLSTGIGTTHLLTTTTEYPNSAAYYDFFRKFRFIGTGIVDPEGYTIEADNVRDTLTIIGGNNIEFTQPQSGVNDTITINGPDYDLVSPTGVANGAVVRLENVGVEYHDLKLTSFRGIRIERVATNEIEFESFGVTETDTLHTVSSRGNLTSNDLVMNNLLVGKIQSTPGIDGFINVSVSSGDAYNGDGTLDNPLLFSPDESQRTDAAKTVTLNFSAPSPGTFNYVAVYRSSAVLLSGYVRLERENPSTLVWETLDYTAGTLARTSYDIENIYAELDAGPVNYRITFDWTGNTEFVNYRVRLTYEVEPIAGNEIIDTDTDTEILTLGTSNGTVNLRGTIGVVETLNFDGLTIFQNNIDGNTSNADINLRPNGTGDLVVTADTDILGDLIVRGGDITTDKTIFNLLNTIATTVNAFGAANTAVIATNASSIQLGNFTLVGSTIDTDDSSGITFVPVVTLNSDLNVENDVRITHDLFVTNNTSITGDTSITGNASITGSLTVGGGIVGSSTLTVDSNAVFKADVEIRGGDLTTNQTTFNLLNTTATTVNAFGAATVINVGSLTGTTTVNNNLTVTGDLIVNGTTVTLNTTTLDVEDLNITLAKGAINAAAANGAGLTVDGASATLLYASSNDSWNFNKLLTATSLQNTPIGTTTRAAGNFTSLDANSTVGLSPLNANVTLSPTGSGTVTINPATSGTIDNTSVGATTASTGRFTTLKIKDTSAAFDLSITPTSSTALTADRSLTFDVVNAARTVKLGANIDIAGTLTLSTALTVQTGAITLTGQAGGSSVTLPSTGTLATLAGSESLTNKKLGSLTSNGIVTTSGGDGTLSVTATTGSNNVVLSTSPTISGTATSITNVGTFALRDTSAAFDLTLAATSSTALTAGRTLTIDVVNAARTLKLGANIDIAGALTLSTALTVQTGAVTLTGQAAGSSVTLPSSGTVATIAGSESLTNKKLGSLTTNGIVTTSGGDGTLSVTATTGTGSVVLGTNPTLSTPTYGTGSSNVDADFTVDASSTTYFAYLQSASGTARTINVSNLTSGRSITLFLRNSNVATKVVNIAASTTTSGFGTVLMSRGAGQTAVTSVTLAATSGLATIRVFNISGTIGGSIA
jgi:hypothetical protein